MALTLEEMEAYEEGREAQQLTIWRSMRWAVWVLLRTKNLRKPIAKPEDLLELKGDKAASRGSGMSEQDVQRMLKETGEATKAAQIRYNAYLAKEAAEANEANTDN